MPKNFGILGFPHARSPRHPALDGPLLPSLSRLALPQKSGSAPKAIIIAASFSANTSGGCDA
ncbi:MAG: hypothetical protein WC295_04505 [Methanoregula sp.]